MWLDLGKEWVNTDHIVRVVAVLDFSRGYGMVLQATFVDGSVAEYPIDYESGKALYQWLEPDDESE